MDAERKGADAIPPRSLAAIELLERLHPRAGRISGGERRPENDSGALREIAEKQTMADYLDLQALMLVQETTTVLVNAEEADAKALRVFRDTDEALEKMTTFLLPRFGDTPRQAFP